MSSANLNTMPQSILNPEVQSTEPLSEVIAAPIESAPAPKQPSKEDILTSTRFAHLSKKEAALVKERESLKQERESFKKEQGEIDKYRKAWEMVNEIAEMQKVDAVGAMRKAGFTDNDLMAFLAQTEDTSSPEEKAAKMVKTEINNFKSEQAKIAEENNKKAQEVQKLEEDRTLAKFKVDIGSKVAASSDKYEYCSFHGESATELIYETISSVLADSNEMLSIEEAAQLVEDFYEEQDKSMNSLKKRSGHITQTPKIIEKEAPPAAPIPQTKTLAQRIESKQYVDNKVPTKTLSNKLTTSITSQANYNLTPQQNKEAIIQKYLDAMKK